jgi:hypothetical protein
MAATITGFRKALSALALQRKLTISPWHGATHRSSNLLEIDTAPHPSVLYVKISNSTPGFWGLTKNQIDRLKANEHQWYVVLLARDMNSGYMFTKGEVVQRINEGKFELGRDGDYKVNENSDCDEEHVFQDIESVLNRIL